MNISKADAIWFNPNNIACATFAEGSDKTEDGMPCARLAVWVPNDPEPFEVFGAKARALFKELFATKEKK